jgi:Spy/CpxP family protein refolding chaperone
MNRLLAVGTMSIIALVMPTQQIAAAPGGMEGDQQGQRGTRDDVPMVGQMLKVLTEKLDLTAEQQARITPILKKLHDLQEALVQDKSLSREERLAKLRPHRYKADEEIREILTDSQKGKLDQYLQGPHPEMHGNLSGATPPPR